MKLQSSPVREADGYDLGLGLILMVLEVTPRLLGSIGTAAGDTKSHGGPGAAQEEDISQGDLQEPDPGADGGEHNVAAGGCGGAGWPRHPR